MVRAGRGHQVWALRGLGLLGLLAAAAVGVFVSGASAGGPDQCPPKHLCLWAKPGYEGKMLALKKTGLSNQIFEKFNDRASSVKNRRKYSSTVYSDRGGDGDALCLAPGHKYPDLTEQLLDNAISSSRLRANSAGC